MLFIERQAVLGRAGPRAEDPREGIRARRQAGAVLQGEGEKEEMEETEEEV